MIIIVARSSIVVPSRGYYAPRAAEWRAHSQSMRGPASERTSRLIHVLLCLRTTVPLDVLPSVLQKKFLVPADLTIGQFMYVIRKVRSLPCPRAL